jgi:hypothetical protein
MSIAIGWESSGRSNRHVGEDRLGMRSMVLTGQTPLDPLGCKRTAGWRFLDRFGRWVAAELDAGSPIETVR